MNDRRTVIWLTDGMVEFPHFVGSASWTHCQELPTDLSEKSSKTFW